MTTKQITHLKSIAHDLKPVLQIGKYGIHQNLIDDILVQLDAHELIKVSLLKNSDVDEVELKSLLITNGVTVVSKIGRILILYRYSKKLTKHIEF